MLVIDEAKLPPPNPANAATIMNVVYDVPGVLHHPPRQHRRDQQQQRADDRPVAAAELGGGDRVRDAHERADQRGHRDQIELARRVDAVDGLRHEQHHHRPDRPDREADVLGEDGPDQVSLGDLLAAGLPGSDVFGVPVLDVAVTGQSSHGTSSTARPFRFDCTAMSPMSTPAHIHCTGSGARGDSLPTHRGNESETYAP